MDVMTISPRTIRHIYLSASGASTLRLCRGRTIGEQPCYFLFDEERSRIAIAARRRLRGVEFYSQRSKRPASRREVRGATADDAIDVQVEVARIRIGGGP